MEKYKKIFEEAWKKHNIRVDIKLFPKYRNKNGYYGYVYYRKKGDVNLSLWTREALTIDEVCDKCVESIQQLIKIVEE